MTRATFVIFWQKLSSFFDWCYYTQVSYTGSWESLVYLKNGPIFWNFAYLKGIFNPWNSKKDKYLKYSWFSIILSNTLLCPAVYSVNTCFLIYTCSTFPSHAAVLSRLTLCSPLKFHIHFVFGLKIKENLFFNWIIAWITLNSFTSDEFS